MKHKHLLIACLSIVLLSFASCKKEDKEKTTAEKIQAKWQLESTVFHDRLSGVEDTETLPGGPGDYFDFRPNGILYYSLDGDTDSVNYALQSDSKIILQQSGFGTIFDIQTLTENALKLYTKETDPSAPDDYSEVTFNLKK